MVRAGRSSNASLSPRLLDAEMLAASAIAVGLTAVVLVAGLPLLLLPARLHRRQKV